MKLATLRNGQRDGRLVVVSDDARRCIDACPVAPTLLDALERWSGVEPALHDLARTVNAPAALGTMPFDARQCLAPLPRTWQWLDGSAFLNHGHLMERAFKVPPVADFETIPLMYQGAADDFLGPHDDVALPSEADQIDFEGEFGVVLSETPMGVTAEEALQHVRLIVLINDWSLRAFGPREAKSGFGFLQAKPSTAFAPIAVTPDALGPAWQGGRVHLRLQTQRNGEWFGHPHGGEMHFHFGQLIAHAARTRKLSAGTIIGSGTVSNTDVNVGSSCIAERRMVEVLAEGTPHTSFLRFRERVRITALHPEGAEGPFGALDQVVVMAFHESPQKSSAVLVR
ncbi:MULTISPECIES: fumarylacetoacetate hydrolase family protein [unclassified Acidovorax]|uniref:fumarylacetoacetate hydrolase family protein n=1 Tax=unclassified Acidovorax TaxID=2684926 RepID=UPI001C48FA68|nr:MULTISPECIES: fumarylacetoacetate hydrolase family protein [unclassified Acidovorax]MBV7428594.1 fumarylacetoacetate hydrolase family protein [Acidovorax sp. sif0732]MBV7450420.1 fumarylacetoacetate hydrolase family protein [Acidovorax sp. sif0715]